MHKDKVLRRFLCETSPYFNGVISEDDPNDPTATRAKAEAQRKTDQNKFCSKRVKAKNPESLTSTKLRKHVGSLKQPAPETLRGDRRNLQKDNDQSKDIQWPNRSLALVEDA
ncbi:hypothetical protein COCON_G00113100 [Conger conger]|uniref:Uncharacterized protein n=1 Tax=Conger conger TaxID=82655 RepID=A0A9Q1DK95_CONCO|nr:hypothetical protein COCON_G00113100 [Conger conger]